MKLILRSCPSVTDSLIAENSTIMMHDRKINFDQFMNASINYKNIHPMFQSQQIPKPHLINLFNHEF